MGDPHFRGDDTLFNQLKIISGGQTGVDRAALDAALSLSIPCGGYCPKGRKAEDGPIDKKYPLTETDSPDYEVRTELNVKESDGTLIFTKGKPTKGTAYTSALTKIHKKPCLIIDLSNILRASEASREAISDGSRLRSNAIEKIQNWLHENKIETLNIAGPRESNFPGIHNQVKEILISALK